MDLEKIVRLVIIVWALSEVAIFILARRNRRRALTRDRGSRTLLWLVIGAGIAAGTAAQSLAAARILLPAPLWRGVSLCLLAGGLAIRWTAILTLGRFFTTRVAIHPGHRLVRTGLYRRVRHPSYSGLLLLILGMGLSFGNWLSLAVIGVPFLAALLYRIRVEEAALVEALGPDYIEYCRSTRRLAPGLF